MTLQVRDTSVDYDDLVGYKARETVPSDLSSVLGEQQELKPKVKPKVKPKPVDPDFPEDWQNLYVNFNSEGEFIEFMKLIGHVPGPKVSTVVFQKKTDNGLLNFL